MKSTGIVRNIDELGRLVIPKEMRKNMGIATDDPVEIFVENDRIILQKYAPACAFCGGIDGITVFREKKICADCLAELKSL